MFSSVAALGLREEEGGCVDPGVVRMTLESMYEDEAALRIFQSAFEVDHVSGRSINRIVVSRFIAKK